MKTIRPGTLVTTLFVCLMMCGCAAKQPITSIKGVWKYGPYPGGYLDQVMVVGKPRQEVVRIRYEDYLARALKKRGVDTVSSYTVIPDLKDVNLENILRTAKSSGMKTVLAAKVVGIDEKNVIFKASVSYDYVTTPGGMFMQPFFEGPRVEKITKVRIEAGLFDIPSQKLLWGVTSAVMNPKSADEAVKDFSRKIIRRLVTDGYIR